MQKIFGHLVDGTAVHALTLDSGDGLRAEILDYGGTLRSLSFPGVHGRTQLVLGLPSLDDYLRDPAYLGVIAGRFANRIAGSRFSIDGVTHQVTANEGRNHLHGGALGLGRRVWGILSHERGSLHLGYRSPAGEEGYPGTLDVVAKFTLSADRLDLDFEARCDAPTPVNLTWHPYFNLAGDAAVPAAAQRLRVPADRYLPIDRELIPVGIADVAGTAFDFRGGHSLAEMSARPDEQLALTGGYDHCLVLSVARGCMAELYSPHSGITMRIDSAMPALQLYEGQGLDRQHPGLGRGLCLEPQGYPNAPNEPGFPDTVLRPGEVYRHRIVYRFS